MVNISYCLLECVRTYLLPTIGRALTPLRGTRAPQALEGSVYNAEVLACVLFFLMALRGTVC